MMLGKNGKRKHCRTGMPRGGNGLFPTVFFYCPVCLNLFEKKRVHLKKGSCSVACGKVLKRLHMPPTVRPTPHSCKTCGSEFMGKGRASYCITCHPNKLTRTHVLAEPLAFECHECGNAFVTRMKRKYCSEYCQRKSCNRISSHTRRARRKGAKVNESLDMGTLYRRDKGRCAICLKRVRLGMAYPKPGAPSMDHIVPLSLGGDHSWMNVQLTHLSCNMKKKTKTLGQLRIF